MGMSGAAPEPFQRLLRSWSRHLAAANKSPATIKLYVGAGELLGAFLAERDGPADPSKVERAQVEGFIADLLATKSASTAGTRYRGLQQFFKWLVLEEEIERSPMEGMKPPKLDEKPVPVVGDHDLSALLKACGGRALRIAGTWRSSGCFWTPASGPGRWPGYVCRTSTWTSDWSW